MNTSKDKEYWKNLILDFMYKEYPIGGSNHIGVNFILSFAGEGENVKNPMQSGLRRLLSTKKIKGMTEEQLHNKITRLMPVVLSMLVDEGKIRFMDTHMYLRHVYYIPTKNKSDVNNWIILEMLKQKKNKLIITLIEYFQKNDMASYDDLKGVLHEKEINFTHDRLKGMLTVLENLNYIKKHDFTSEDRFTIIYSKPHISESTIKLKAREIRQKKNLAMMLGAQRGRDFEKKIEEILKKEGKEVRKICYDHVTPTPSEERE